MTACESRGYGEFSPGRVEDAETLLRVVIDPDHLEQGKLHVAAFSVGDLTKTDPNGVNGVSVERKEKTTLLRLQAVADLWCSRQSARRFSGVALLSCLEVRSIVDDGGNRVFRVVSWAETIEEYAHATIGAANGIKDSQVRKFRSRLIEIAKSSGIVDPEFFFSPVIEYSA